MHDGSYWESCWWTNQKRTDVIDNQWNCRTNRNLVMITKQIEKFPYGVSHRISKLLDTYCAIKMNYSTLRNRKVTGGCMSNARFWGCRDGHSGSILVHSGRSRCVVANVMQSICENSRTRSNLSSKFCSITQKNFRMRSRAQGTSAIDPPRPLHR